MLDYGTQNSTPQTTHPFSLFSTVTSMRPQTLSAHVLHAIASAQRDGRSCNLETLAAGLDVRRADVRAAISALHREGFLDALRMRLTLPGFALARALSGSALPRLRERRRTRPGRDEASQPARVSAVRAA